MEYREPELSHIVELNNDAAITNLHTLSLQIGEHTEVVVNRAMSELIKKATLYLKVKTGKVHDQRYTLNIPRNREGITMCFAYCWINDSCIYNILVGKNEDGTERVEETVDTPPVPSEMENIPINQSWDIEEGPVIARTAIKLAPIVGRYWCKYGPEEIKSAKARAARSSKVVPECTGCIIGIGPGIIYSVEDNFEADVLFANRVPGWVKSKMIHDKIAPFAPGVKLNVDMYAEGSSSSATITFSPGNGKDAAFALQMVKKLVFPNKGKGKDCMLILNHLPKEDEEEEEYN
jgi:hypothetical protein